MIRRAAMAGLLALLVLNTLDGAFRIAGFLQRDGGEEALASGKLGKAYTRLVASLRWQPDDAPSYILIARVIHLAQKNGIALEPLNDLSVDDTYAVGAGALAAAISRNPADAWAWSTLAESHSALETRRSRVADLKEAVEAAREGRAPGDASTPRSPIRSLDGIIAAATLKASELEPQVCFNHDFLARFYWERGLMDLAQEEARTSFAMMPAAQAHPWLSDKDMTAALGDAILEGIDASASSPQFDSIMTARARADVLGYLERIPEAIDALAKYREIGGPNVAALCDFRTGKLLQAQDEFSESIPYLKNAIQEDRSGEFSAETYLFLARAYANLEDHENAVRAYREYTKRKPGSLNLMLSLASELEKTGRSAEAEQIYVGMVKRFPSRRLPYERLIEFLKRERKLDQAAKYQDELNKLNP